MPHIWICKGLSDSEDVFVVMRKYPRGMRPSTLEERREYYTREFDVGAVTHWAAGRRGMRFAMIPGRHTGIVAPEHAANRDDVMIIDDWSSIGQIRDHALDYLPEGLYYDRNRYDDTSACSICTKSARACERCGNRVGQQLAFDLDPENVDCLYHGTIGDKMARGRGLSFCMLEFKNVRGQAVRLASELRRRFKLVEIVYSGRGFHVVVDDEDAYSMTLKERRRLAVDVAKRYAIDPWVTSGGSRLMRLPGSLNGIVSRNCVIMKQEEDLVRFDPRTSISVMPRFLRSSRP